MRDYRNQRDIMGMREFEKIGKVKFQLNSQNIQGNTKICLKLYGKSNICYKLLTDILIHIDVEI